MPAGVRVLDPQPKIGAHGNPVRPVATAQGTCHLSAALLSVLMQNAAGQGGLGQGGSQAPTSICHVPSMYFSDIERCEVKVCLHKLAPPLWWL